MEAGSCVAETAGIKLSGPTPAWLESELPGLGILVTVMPEEMLAALPVVGAAESGRDVNGAEAGGRDGAADELALAAGSAVEAKGDGEAEVGVAAKVLDGDEAAGFETLARVGRNFLLERSTEPDDCHERL